MALVAAIAAATGKEIGRDRIQEGERGRGRETREAETERSEERTFAMISLVLLFLRPSLAASLAS